MGRDAVDFAVAGRRRADRCHTFAVVILFDLDDTLLHDAKSAQQAFVAAAERAWRRHQIDPAALTASVRARARELWHGSPTHRYARVIGISHWEGLWARFLGDDPNLTELRVWAPSYRLESWRRALLDHGIDDLQTAGELADAFPVERRARHELFPDALPALDDLGRDHPLGLVTNGAPDLQREKIRGTDLARHFEEIVVSGELGYGKPDPRVFAVALERLRTPPDDAVMIGNSLESDILGATRAGVRAIWLNRDGAPPDPEITPDAEIRSLAQVRSALAAP